MLSVATETGVEQTPGTPATNCVHAARGGAVMIKVYCSPPKLVPKNATDLHANIDTLLC
jgi:hypothetical protein